jgi:proteasome accessory factor C
MNKNISAPLLRTARLLDLVPFLSTHQGIALKDLARHFDVSPSQMSADLTTLWMCGLPGYTPLELMDLEFESGYVTISNAPTLAKPRTISFQEGVALLLGLDLVASSLPDEREDLLIEIAELKNRLAQILGVPVQLSAVAPASGSIQTAIAKAVTTNSGLRIRYHSIYNDQISERNIKAFDIYHLENQQYLRAYCFTAFDYRDFRIDRILQATPTDVEDIVHAQTEQQDKIDFSLTTNYLTREVWENYGISDSSVDLDNPLSSYSALWIERSIMSCGGAVRLTAPASIRTEIAAKAQVLLNRYKES